MVQSASRGKQFVCSRCQLLCYRLISWLRVYSHQWINKDCLQTRNMKVDVIIFSLLRVIHFSGFIEALDSKGILLTLKKVLRQVNSWAFSSKWVKRYEQKLSICWGKQELARTCRGENPKSSKISSNKRACLKHEMAKWRNDEMTKWRNGEMAKWN